MRKLSLRWRLTLVTVGVLAVMCAISTGFSLHSANMMIQPVSMELQTIGVKAQDVSIIADAVVLSNTASSSAFEFEVAGIFDDYYYYDDYRVADDYVNYLSDDEYQAYWTGLVQSNPYFVDVVVPDEYAYYEDDTLKIAVSAATQSQKLAQYTETAAMSVTVAQRGFNYSNLIFMAVIIVLGGVVVYFTSGYAMKPVRVLNNEIKGIGGDKLSHRIESANGPGEISQLAGSFNDMLDRLQHAFAVQQRFSTAAAHELKTPLAAIRTNIDVLNMDENPTQADYAELMDVVTRQTERMTQLVDDLFSMSSLQECRMEDDISVAPMLVAIEAELDDFAAEKDIAITVEAEEAEVRGNIVLLTRAVSNLAENAVRYTQRGGRVLLSCGREAGRVVITVSDNGPGVPEEHLPNIFDPFYRVDPSRSRKLGGAGIGLSIAAEIAVLHGGKIEASNREVGGAEFRLTLPEREVK